jgi:hypothetical protein
MLVKSKPRVTELKRSWSVGSEPDAVDRHLKTAAVKSRGFGSMYGAFSPLPSPSTPWQPMQKRWY